MKRQSLHPNFHQGSKLFLSAPSHTLVSLMLLHGHVQHLLIPCPDPRNNTYKADRSPCLNCDPLSYK